MHDIKWIRENPDAFDAAMNRRGLEGLSGKLLAIDERKRGLQTKLQELQAERNQKSKLIGEAKKNGEDAQLIMDEVAKIKDEMTAIEAEMEKDALSDELMRIPNILDAEVPEGTDESGNQEVRRHGEPKKFSFEAKQHFELGEALGMMDFETAAKMSGSRFVLLSGPLARLERALAQFMLDLHSSPIDFAAQPHLGGYEEISPPLLVRDNALLGTGQLPKFAEDLFKTTTDHWLIPTAEVSLTNIVADKIIDPISTMFPLRFTAFTPCFRSEAGAAGKDTRGMIRQHQFFKVELVSICRPEQSKAEHERMTGCAEEVLKRLGLPFRTMMLCSGDTGFGAQRTYDLEVWLPGQNAYREISSCSNCGPFQARRMKARFRPEGQDKGTEFVHTLNGSGVAVGRALIAVMENYQQADGSIAVPEVLQPYMGGLKVIKK